MKDVTKPRIARYKPFYYKPVPDKTYFWCACGRSETQPFCDGSHKGTGIEPVKFVATEDHREVLFCGCKQSADKPFCDGTHNNLRDTYEEADPDSPENKLVARVLHHRDGRLELNGRCYVAKVEKVPATSAENLRWGALVTRETGAEHQSMFFMDVARGETPVMTLGDSHVVLLATSGRGEIEISGRRFPIAPEMGVYVRPGEMFSVHNDDDEAIRLYLSACPQVERPVFVELMPANFDSAHPQRTVDFDPEKRQRMGDRTFQLLVDRSVGSDLVTQFIGDIPLSMAAPHRHLYEETLVILKGKGCMWTEDLKADVTAGDAIFLPAKQRHSLQCTDPDGMTVAGVIYPDGDPDINF